MKIMYLLFSFSVGGTERLVADICNQMAKTENEIYLYVVNDVVSQELISSLDTKIHIKLQSRKSNSGDKIKTLFLIYNFIKENGIDVVHCNSFNSPELLLIAKMLMPKIKIIHTIHGMGQYSGLPKYKRVIRNIICDRFIAISNNVASDISNNGCSQKKIRVIYNAIREEKFCNAKLKIFNKERVVLGCAARIMPAVKGQDVLIDAVAILKNQYPNIKCLFAGGVAEGEKENYLKLVKTVKDKKLEENVEFLGLVDDIPTFLNSIDICVVPSRSEGFGLTLVEAMVMGIPCVASNVEGPKEIVEREKVGHLFRVDDAEDRALVLQNTIEDYQHERNFAWSNKDRIISRFNMAKMCQELMDQYS